MRVYRFDNYGGLDGLHLYDEPVPSPQRGEVLLRIKAVSLNYRDIAIPLGRYVRDAKPSLVPCSDAAAEVVELGKGVDDYPRATGRSARFNPGSSAGRLPATADSDSYDSGQDGWLTEYKVVTGIGRTCSTCATGPLRRSALPTTSRSTRGFGGSPSIPRRPRRPPV